MRPAAARRIVEVVVTGGVLLNRRWARAGRVGSPARRSARPELAGRSFCTGVPSLGAMNDHFVTD